jgi:hypothetical protein
MCRIDYVKRVYDEQDRLGHIENLSRTYDCYDDIWYYETGSIYADYASSLNVMLATRCRRGPNLGTQLVCLNRATFFLEAS